MCGPNNLAFSSSVMYVKEMTGVLLLLMSAIVSAQQQFLGPVAAPYVVPPPALTDTERSLKNDVDSYLSDGSLRDADLKQRYDVGLLDYLNYFPWYKKLLFDANLLTIRKSTPVASNGHSSGQHSEGQRRGPVGARPPANKAQFPTKPAEKDPGFMIRFITQHPNLVTLVQLSLLALLLIAILISVATCVSYTVEMEGFFSAPKAERLYLRKSERESFRERECVAYRKIEWETIPGSEDEDVCETESEAVRATARDLSRKKQTAHERKSSNKNYEPNRKKFCPQFMGQEEEVFGRHVIGVVLNDGSIIKVSGGFIETRKEKSNPPDCATS